MRSLFRGDPTAARPRRSRIPRWYLFAADLLLVATALLVMYKGPAPLSGNEKFFGAVAVVLGAGLAVLAICMRDRKDT
jgi:peptidoglycan/LPS O-acetylase OafA/YrhL